MKRLILLLGFILTLMSCTGIPEGVEPVTQFDKSRYLGTWYEIARLDHSFERGLERVTANYSLREDGGIAVVNKGYNPQEDEWTVAEGKAYFVSEETLGHLKVSFFGPFYASYVIAELDKDNYEYALVTGPDTSFMWILARSPALSDDVLSQLKEKASAYGFPVNDLIYVKHE